MTRDSRAAALSVQVDEAAILLLGRLLSAGGVVLRLTEVEAYDGADDPASHAWRGRTERNAVMFGPAGFCYVYRSYGMHWCLNVVTGMPGAAAAVLLRAGEVVEGVPTAIARSAGALRPYELARGPGRLTRALGIDRDLHGADLVHPRSPLRLLPATGEPVGEVAHGPRVGVSRAADVPWRFWLAGDRTVSAYRRSPRAARVPG